MMPIGSLCDHIRFQARLRPGGLAVFGPAGPIAYGTLTHDIDALRYWYPGQFAAVPYRLARELRKGNFGAALRDAMASVRLLRQGRIGAHDPFWNLSFLLS